MSHNTLQGPARNPRIVFYVPSYNTRAGLTNLSCVANVFVQGCRVFHGFPVVFKYDPLSFHTATRQRKRPLHLRLKTGLSLTSTGAKGFCHCIDVAACSGNLSGSLRQHSRRRYERQYIHIPGPTILKHPEVHIALGLPVCLQVLLAPPAALAMLDATAPQCGWHADRYTSLAHTRFGPGLCHPPILDFKVDLRSIVGGPEITMMCGDKTGNLSPQHLSAVLWHFAAAIWRQSAALLPLFCRQCDLSAAVISAISLRHSACVSWDLELYMTQYLSHYTGQSHVHHFCAP
ncbi:hypothetical protein DFH09DRAFT_1071638 [Mycena vulgaris]|nr:hypothetical protein DFH09DRAFT_1071638 [Mycena vulgaris]